MEESRPPTTGDSATDPAPRPSRRTYPAEYRARVLAEYEEARHGQKSAVLRREGIYQTLVAEWAKARDAEAAGTTYRRERKSRSKDQTSATRAVKLEAENQRLTRQLAHTRPRSLGTGRSARRTRRPGACRRSPAGPRLGWALGAALEEQLQEPVHFSHHVQCGLHLRELAGQPLVLGLQLHRPGRRRLILRAGLPLTTIRRPGRLGVPGFSPLRDEGLIDTLAAQHRGLLPVPGLLVLREHSCPVLRRIRPTRRPRRRVSGRVPGRWGS